MLVVVWTLVPAHPGSLHRPCPRCGADQPHTPTGRFRVNAHRKRLDVWLLVGCDGCGRTWKLPVLERIAVSAVPPVRLDRFHANDPDEIAACASDPALLAAAGVRLVAEPAQIVGPAAAQLRPPLELHLRCPPEVRERLDAVLARGLGWSRSQVRRAVDGGWLRLQGGRRALRAPPRDGQRLELWPGAEEQPAPAVADADPAAYRSASSEG